MVHASASYFPSMKQRDVMKKVVDKRNVDYDIATQGSTPKVQNLLREFHSKNVGRNIFVYLKG